MLLKPMLGFSLFPLIFTSRFDAVFKLLQVLSVTPSLLFSDFVDFGNRGSYMSAHVLSWGKRDKMRGLSSIVSPFRTGFNKFNKTRARNDIKITLKSHFFVFVFNVPPTAKVIWRREISFLP